MSIDLVGNIPFRLRDELERLKISGSEASRRISEKSPQRLKEVLNDRQRLSAEMLAKLVLECGVDAVYVLTGQRNLHAITIDHVRGAFQMVADAEAQLPVDELLTNEQRVGAVCSLLKTAQAVGEIPDQSAAIAVLMALQ